MTRVKICGITTVEDALLAAEAGAAAVGLVFSDSPRRVPLATAEQIAAALPPLVSVVGVFADADSAEVVELAERVPLTAIQLNGQEPPEYCELLSWPVIKRFDIHENDTPETLAQRLGRYRVAGHLVAWGGLAGQALDRVVERGLARRLIVSGELEPGDAREAIRRLRPFALDVVAAAPGHAERIDPGRLNALLAAVREADAD